jgi:hypothetical protein
LDETLLSGIIILFLPVLRFDPKKEKEKKVASIPEIVVYTKS